MHSHPHQTPPTIPVPQTVSPHEQIAFVKHAEPVRVLDTNQTLLVAGNVTRMLVIVWPGVPVQHQPTSVFTKLETIAEGIYAKLTKQRKT